MKAFDSGATSWRELYGGTKRSTSGHEKRASRTSWYLQDYQLGQLGRVLCKGAMKMRGKDCGTNKVLRTVKCDHKQIQS
jgi:hypothetical protein